MSQSESSHLGKVDLFAGLTASELETIKQLGRVRTYPVGAVVVNEGDDGNGLFIVESGSLKVFLMDESGREIILSLLDPGDYFGELALLDDAPRSASVMVMEKAELLQIPRPAFMELIAEHSSCMQAVVRNLVARIRSLTDNVRVLALADVFGRISRLFDSLAVPEGDHKVINRQLSQQELANMVGASREMVNRILRDLVTGGYVVMESHRIVIKRKLPLRW